MQVAEILGGAAPVAVPAVVAFVVTLLTNKLTARRETRARGVQARRAAILDVQKAVVQFRVARQRYGAELNRSLADRKPGGAHVLQSPEIPAVVDQAVFEANTVYDAALARLDERDAGLTTAATEWASASLVESMSKEVDAAAEQEAFDTVNTAVRAALAATGT